MNGNMREIMYLMMAMGERTTQKISEFQGTWYLKVIHMLYSLLKHKVDIIIAV